MFLLKQGPVRQLIRQFDQPADSRPASPSWPVSETDGTRETSTSNDSLDCDCEHAASGPVATLQGDAPAPDMHEGAGAVFKQAETTCLSPAATLPDDSASTSIPQTAPAVDSQGETSLQVAAQAQSHQHAPRRGRRVPQRRRRRYGPSM